VTLILTDIVASTGTARGIDDRPWPSRLADSDRSLSEPSTVTRGQIAIMTG
jgi:hypothetical protein